VLPWRRKLFSLGIGLKDMSVVDAHSQRLITALPLAEYLPGAATPATADWAPSIDAVLAQTNMPSGGDMVLTISDAWVRYFMLDIPEGVGNMAELHALAAGRFEALFGSSPEGWKLEADWKASGQVLVCALPNRLVDVAATLSAAGAWKIRTIQPYALRLQSIFHSQIPNDGWLCCFARRSVVAMLVVAGEIVHVRRFPSVAPLTAVGMGGLLAAEAMRIGAATPEVLCALGIVPKLPDDGQVGGMRLVVARGSKVVQVKQGRMSESMCLARQGAFA